MLWEYDFRQFHCNVCHLVNSESGFIFSIPFELYDDDKGEMPVITTGSILTFDCLAASNWPPGHPRSDHHVSNPHRPD